MNAASPATPLSAGTEARPRYLNGSEPAAHKGSSFVRTLHERAENTKSSNFFLRAQLQIRHVFLHYLFDYLIRALRRPLQQKIVKLAVGKRIGDSSQIKDL